VTVAAFYFSEMTLKCPVLSWTNWSKRRVRWMGSMGRGWQEADLADARLRFSRRKHWNRRCNTSKWARDICRF